MIQPAGLQLKEIYSKVVLACGLVVEPSLKTGSRNCPVPEFRLCDSS